MLLPFLSLGVHHFRLIDLITIYMYRRLQILQTLLRVDAGVWFVLRYQEAWRFCEALDNSECWQELATAAMMCLDIDLGRNAITSDCSEC